MMRLNLLKTTTVFALLVFDSYVVVAENNAVEPEKHIWTSEWQTVKPGQGVPRGLHVRMNLETGLTEAKLMAEEDHGAPTDLTIGSQIQHLSDLEIMKDIKDVLHKIPDDGIHLKAEGSKEHFRSIDELKSEFEAVDMMFTTETEILAKFLAEVKGGDVTNERMIVILKEMEYYVHQYDNAQNFIKMGGLPLVTPQLNSSDADVRSSVAFLLGSAMQSNPSVQVSAADSGLIQKLLHRLAIDPSTVVRNKVLYALSCLLRRFPHAQQKFLELGGLHILTEFFNGSGEELQRLQLKAVTMVYDLILEDQLTSANLENDDKLGNERKRQYKKVGMKRAVIEAGWCALVPRLLSATEHDVREKVLKTMALVADDCRENFTKWLAQISTLHSHYIKIAADNDSDAYFTELGQMIGLLIKELNGFNREEL